MEKQKHKVYVWHEGGDWHWLHNFGATSHEGKGFGSREAALAAATKDLSRRANPEPTGPEVIEVEV